jgi:hypothetical protein
MYAWNLGPYDIAIVGNTVSVTDSREDLDLDDESTWALPPTQVDGLAKHVAKGVALRLAYLDDMPLIHIIQKGEKYGWAYVINLSEPLFSEWGSCGIFVAKEG